MELYSGASNRKKVRTLDIVAMKGIQKIVSLTCYDACFAQIIQKSEIDFVLVGDSLGHVVQGSNTTLHVTVDDIVYHTKCVASSLKTPLLVADVPFGVLGRSEDFIAESCIRLFRAGAEAVKIEGASPAILQNIQNLVTHGMPVMGHIGLTPQSVHALGGYKIQGRGDDALNRLIDDAIKLQNAGCFAIVLELIDAPTALAVTQALKIPTIGIGSGAGCDGQILVTQDLLGMNLSFKPKFLKHFAQLETEIQRGLKQYIDEVHNETYPS